MNVLSLFDGLSCGMFALDRAGIPVKQYFACEIEKSAMEVSKANYPDIIQLSDVTKVKGLDLPKIDLVIGGSPCQGFSFAGKGLNFDDPRSKLFFEYVRLIEECKPKFFLLENVKMKRCHEQIITDTLKVEPILINSSLFTAHDRKRLYWTNIPVAKLPNDQGVTIQDILEEADESLYLKSSYADRYIPTKNYVKNSSKSCVIGKLSPYQGDRVFDVEAKASSLSASGGNNGGGGCNIIIDPKNEKLRRLSVSECEKLQGLPVGATAMVKAGAAYKALGNGWTVDTIAHIFKGIQTF